MGRFARAYSLTGTYPDAEEVFDIIWDSLYQNVRHYATSSLSQKILDNYLLESRSDSFLHDGCFHISFGDAAPTWASLCHHWFEVSLAQVAPQINALLAPLGCSLQAEQPYPAVFAMVDGQVFGISEDGVSNDEGRILSATQWKRLKGLCQCDLCKKVRKGMAPARIHRAMGEETSFKSLRTALKQPLNARDLFLGKPSTLNGTYELGPEIGTLKQLRTLYIESAAQLPEELGNLTRLEKLSLNFNVVTTLPASLARLTRLRELRIWGGYVETLPDLLPPQLSELVVHDSPVTRLPPLPETLQELEISSSILEEFPAALRVLKNLKRFQFTVASRHQPAPSLIESLESFPYSQWEGLENIHIAGVPLTARVLDELARLPRLRTIHLIGAQHIGELPPSLQKATRLEGLSLPRAGLTRLPPWLSRLPALQTLDVSENLLTCVEPWDAPALQRLNLARNQLTRLSDGIGSMQSLENLNLDYNQLTELPSELGRCSRLKLLSMSTNLIAELPESLGDLSQLNDLYIDNLPLRSLPESLNHLHNLTYLVIGGQRYPEVDAKQLLQGFRLQEVRINITSW